MFCRDLISVNGGALLMTALLLAAPAVTMTEGRPCPVDQGACFAQLDEGDFFWLSEGTDTGDLDGDGDIDHVLLYVDGVNDFITTLPNGKTRLHANEPVTDLTYCPFSALDDDGNYVPPTDDCVFGTGRFVANGTLAGPFGLCGGAVQADGYGARASDGAEFEFTARFVTNGNCDIVQFFIDAREL